MCLHTPPCLARSFAPLVTRIPSDSRHLLGLWQDLLRRGKQIFGAGAIVGRSGNWIGPKVAYAAGPNPLPFPAGAPGSAHYGQAFGLFVITPRSAGSHNSCCRVPFWTRICPSDRYCSGKRPLRSGKLERAQGSNPLRQQLTRQRLGATGGGCSASKVGVDSVLFCPPSNPGVSCVLADQDVGVVVAHEATRSASS
jgi:hypothetical protein